jgi:hypothetical protein
MTTDYTTTVDAAVPRAAAYLLLVRPIILFSGREPFPVTGVIY